MMKGWKTWLAAAGLCGLGVYLIQMGEKEFGMVCIFNGLGLVGIGSKVEKARVYPVNINLNGQQDKPQ